MKKLYTIFLFLSAACQSNVDSDNACYTCKVTTTYSATGGYSQYLPSPTTTTTDVCNGTERRNLEKGTTTTTTSGNVVVRARSVATCRKK